MNLLRIQTKQCEKQIQTALGAVETKKCKDKASVVCQPPSCSVDKKSKCTSTCTWKDCESKDNSCHCDASQGECVACSAPTPHCSNYQCTQCADYCGGANRCGGPKGNIRH